MYKYFISYQHKEGYGCCEIKRAKLITRIEDIHAIRKTIEDSNGIKGVVVIISNYLMNKSMRNIK